MFCPNCGNRINESDNYCSLCGKNLKNVKVLIKPSENNDKNNKNFSDESTRIFHSITDIGSIDSTDELKDIIKAVDEKISKNISDYEEKSKIDTLNMPGPKKTDSKELYDFSKEKKLNSTINSLNDLSIKENSDAKKTNRSDISDEKKINTEKKKSLKDYWDEFINEDDDEFSILSSFKNNTNEVSSSKEKENKEVNSKAIYDNSLNKNLKVGINKIPENLESMNTHLILDKEDKKNFLSNSPDKSNNYNNSSLFHEKKQSITYKNFTDMVNEELKKENPLSLENKVVEKDFKEANAKNKSLFDKVKSKFYFVQKDSFHSGIEKNKINEKANPKKSDLDKNEYVEKKLSKAKVEKSIDKNYNKNFKLNLNIENNKLKIKKNIDNSNKKIFKSIKPKLNKIKNHNPKKKDKTSDKKIIFNKLNLKDKNIKNNLYNFIDSLSLFLNDKEVILKNKYGENFYKLALAIAIILSIVPIFISQRMISTAIIIFIALKLILKMFQFYFSLKVATEKSDLDTSEVELKHNAIINWLICEFVLFFAFIFSPWNGFFNFNFLSSLTALPIASIILFALSLSISIAQYWKNEFLEHSKVNFIAWYLITFMLVEFIGKLLFIIGNVVIN
ncbi:MAG: zinc-ribbon domain-containing protein [Peptoniphilaceae bacterium]